MRRRRRRSRSGRRRTWPGSARGRRARDTSRRTERREARQRRGSRRTPDTASACRSAPFCLRPVWIGTRVAPLVRKSVTRWSGFGRNGAGPLSDPRTRIPPWGCSCAHIHGGTPLITSTDAQRSGTAVRASTTAERFARPRSMRSRRGSRQRPTQSDVDVRAAPAPPRSSRGARAGRLHA